jgi:hypothetical protein
MTAIILSYFLVMFVALVLGVYEEELVSLLPFEVVECDEYVMVCEKEQNALMAFINTQNFPVPDIRPVPYSKEELTAQDYIDFEQMLKDEAKDQAQMGCEREFWFQTFEDYQPVVVNARPLPAPVRVCFPPKPVVKQSIMDHGMIEALMAAARTPSQIERMHKFIQANA